MINLSMFTNKHKFIPYIETMAAQLNMSSVVKQMNSDWENSDHSDYDSDDDTMSQRLSLRRDALEDAQNNIDENYEFTDDEITEHRQMDSISCQEDQSVTRIPQTSIPIQQPRSPSHDSSLSGESDNAGTLTSQFNKSVGPAIRLSAQEATALDYFLLIFGKRTIEEITTQTNLYASQKPPAESYKWHDTSENEIAHFLGIQIVMGIQN